jgi:hypothetical protein
MRTVVTVEIDAARLEAARAAWAQAVASGAFGAGYAVRRDGERVVFDGERPGHLVVRGDGRAVFEASLWRDYVGRTVEAVGIATVTSVAATLGWSLLFHVALPLGAAVGAVYGSARVVADRARVRRQQQALVASLPILLDAGS